MQCFHQGTRNRETNSRVLFFKTTLTRQIWEDLFFKVIRIACSIRRDQTWRNKNFMSSLSICASVNYNDKRKNKDWHDHLLNLDENMFRPQEELSMREKSFPRYSDPKYARNGRSEKSSRTSTWRNLRTKIIRKSWVITKAHFSVAGNGRADEFMNDSGEFQEAESNYSGILSYVSNQLAMIPSSRSMLSREWWFRFLWRNSRKSTGSVDRTPTHKTHLCSTICSQARTAQLMRLAQELHCYLCAPEQVLSSGV